MEQVARVVLALEAPEVAEEVMHFLDRSGHVRVVATAQDDRQLEAAVRQMEPDAVIAQPSLMGPDLVRRSSLLAVDTRESVSALRAAIRAGAAGFFVWPSDRDALAHATAGVLAAPAPSSRRAAVVAVHGARGGTGTTFVATHLAAALARVHHDCVLLDADPLYGDTAAAMGAPTQDVHTIADVLPLVHELTAEGLDAALWRHPAGFRTLLPPPPEDALAVRAADLRAVTDAAAAAADVVVLHLPRALDPVARSSFETADRVVEVLSLDVLSFRAAKRALEAMGPQGLGERLDFVVNRAARQEVVPADVARVFGVEPLAVLPFDRAVERAQDHGRILPERSRMARRFDHLAARLLEIQPELTAATAGP